MLRKKGYEPVNPTTFWLCKWYDKLEKVLGDENAYRLTLLYDLWRLMKCEMIYKLPGWQQSRGANIESCVAFHFKIWPVPKDVIKKLDKRLGKLRIKFEKNNGNIEGETSADSRYLCQHGCGHS